MKKKTPVFLPICWTINGCLAMLLFCMDCFYPTKLDQMILHGLCAVLAVVCSIAQWVRYKKEKTDIDDECQNK